MSELLDIIREIGVELTVDQIAKYDTLPENKRSLIPRLRLNEKIEQLKVYENELKTIRENNRDHEKLQTQLIDFETQLTNEKKRNNTLLINGALEREIGKFNVRDSAKGDITKFLDLEKITINGDDKVNGIAEQLTELMKTKDFLFTPTSQGCDDRKDNIVVKGATPVNKNNATQPKVVDDYSKALEQARSTKNQTDIQNLFLLREQALRKQK